MKLDGKVALITGGTSGIGRAAAKLFRDEGARVVAVGLDRDRLEETRRELGAGATVLRADLRDVGEIDELIRTVREGFGAIDVLFANAGKDTAAPLEAVTEEQVDEQLAVNFKGVLFTVQKAAPILADGSSVVLTTSYLDAVGTPGLSVLSATKAAARSLARSPLGGASPMPIVTIQITREGKMPDQPAQDRCRTSTARVGPLSAPTHSALMRSASSGRPAGRIVSSTAASGYPPPCAAGAALAPVGGGPVQQAVLAG